MIVQEWSLLKSRLPIVCLSIVGVLMVLSVQILLLGWRIARPVEADAIAVGLVTDGGVGDMSFNWLSYQGLLRAEDELGVIGTVYTSTSEGDYWTDLEQCAVTDTNDLCISVGFPMANATLFTAADNPSTQFAIVDFSWQSYPDNLRGMVFAADEAGYLAGTLAGLMTVSETIGAIGGMEVPPVQDFVEPYRNGADCANPDVNVLIQYAGTFDDPDLGAQIAQGMIGQGADVIFGVGGMTGNGGLLTATQSGAWAIGVDADQWVTLFESGVVDGSEKLLSSAMKRVDNAVFDAISDVVSDTFTSGTVVYDLAGDGVGLAPFHETDPFVPQSVRYALGRVERGIIWGVIDVNGPCPAHIHLPLVLKNFGP